MYQVTIVWQDAEIGYGEGESAKYATQEAIENVDSIYKTVRPEWSFEIKRTAP